MIAPQRDAGRAAFEDAPDMRRERRREGRYIGIVESQVAVVDDAQLTERRSPSHRAHRALCSALASRTCPRPQPRAGPIGDRLVERHPGHRDVHAAQLLRVAPPQERQRPPKVFSKAHPVSLCPREGLVHEILAVFQCHTVSPICSAQHVRPASARGGWAGRRADLGHAGTHLAQWCRLFHQSARGREAPTGAISSLKS